MRRPDKLPYEYGVLEPGVVWQCLKRKRLISVFGKGKGLILIWAQLSALAKGEERRTRRSLLRGRG